MKTIGFYIVSLVGKVIFKQKSSLLHNTIDADALLKKCKIDTDEYNYEIVYLGRITYQKNPQRLVKICELLTRKQRNIKIAIIGTGDLQVEFKEQLERLSLNNVQLLGYISNPFKTLSQSKVMIMTSRCEGIPMSALEAMAFGVPIVSTPVDGLNDLVNNGVTGYIIDDEKMSDIIIEIVNNPELHHYLSSNASSRFEEYNDRDAYRDEIIRAYR